MADFVKASILALEGRPGPDDALAALLEFSQRPDAEQVLDVRVDLSDGTSTTFASKGESALRLLIGAVVERRTAELEAVPVALERVLRFAEAQNADADGTSLDVEVGEAIRQVRAAYNDATASFIEEGNDESPN